MITQINTRKIILISICIIMLTLFSSLSYARTAGNPWKPSRILDFQWYAKNQWRMPITNYGTFGYGIGRAGGEWPRGSGNMYIYGAGIWVGSMPSRTETLVTCGYNPSSGASEFTPGAWDNAPGGYSSRSFERVYIYPEDWPPEPSDFPQSMRDSFETPLRMPVSATDTLKDYFFPVPRKTVSSYDAWTVMNDRDPERHTTPRIPVGVEVYQTTYAWNLPWNRDIVFFILNVRNVTSDTLKKMYLGMACDADIGGANDDMCGLILRKYVKNRALTDSVYADNVGFVYDNDFDEGWATPPGYIGFDFLQSPYAYTDGIDNNFNGTTDEGPDGIDNNGNGLIDEPAEIEQLGMVSYKMFTLQAGDPTTNYTQYLAMAGYNYWETPPPYSPFDSLDASPNDKRFLQATGPFNLAPNEIATVTIGVIAAPSNPLAGVGELYQLAVASSAAQAAYDNNWIMPEAPASPNLTLIPGEGRITLIWDDIAERTPDKFFTLAATLRNPFYRQYDFEGYKVYRSQTGNTGEWTLLDQFDKIDGLIYQDLTQPESLRTNATDKGLSYAYIDSSNIRLGFPYYYAVTAYDINTLGGDPNPTDSAWLSLESGISPKATISRTTPSNYVTPQFNITKIRGSERLNLNMNPRDLTNYAITNESYYLKFIAPIPTGATTNRIPIYSFFVENSAGETLVPLNSFTVNIRASTNPLTLHPTIFDSVITNLRVSSDSVTIDTTIAYMPIIDLGFTLDMDSIPWQFYDRVETKLYPQDSVQLPTNLTANYGLWAFRGSNFRIVFKEKYPGGPTTAEVYDITLDQEIPYHRMSRSIATTPDADSANGWSFAGLVEPRGSDTLVSGISRYLLLCGGQINLNKGNAVNANMKPVPGDTWFVYSQRLSCAPSYSEIKVVSVPMQLTNTTANLNVKVVPNPYIVRNEWERHPDYRKIKFINLPDQCTIRIYNLVGDLIKTITHNATNTQDPGNVPLEAGGDENWDLLTESSQKPAPGIYIFHIESEVGNQIGKFAIIY